MRIIFFNVRGEVFRCFALVAWGAGRRQLRFWFDELSYAPLGMYINGDSPEAWASLLLPSHPHHTPPPFRSDVRDFVVSGLHGESIEGVDRLCANSTPEALQRRLDVPHHGNPRFVVKYVITPSASTAVIPHQLRRQSPARNVTCMFCNAAMQLAYANYDDTQSAGIWGG